MHGRGDWMPSLRSMRMEMDGNLDGTSRMSSGDVFAAGCMIAPESMTMDMHMLGAMYGVSGDLAVMLMLPWLDVEMDHVTAGGARFTTRSSGVQAGAVGCTPAKPERRSEYPDRFY